MNQKRLNQINHHSPLKTRKEDYSSQILKIHSQNDDNTTCFDCGCKGTTYFVINFATFVCSKCAGVLRELRYRVKGLSASIFTEEEKNNAEIMGNTNARKVWMGCFNYKSNIIPTHPLDFKKHLKDKYIGKKYYKKNKHMKRVRFDTEEDSESEPDGPNEEDEDEEEEEMNSSYEDDEEDDNDEEDEKEENNEKKNDKKGNELISYPSKINIKKPNARKLLSESMKISKMKWEEMWVNADLNNNIINANDFVFADDNNTISNTSNINLPYSNQTPYQNQNNPFL